MGECKCSICDTRIDGYDSYDLKGVISCEDCLGEVVKMMDFEHNKPVREDDFVRRGLEGSLTSNSSKFRT